MTKPTTEEDRLIRAVVADPDNDEPRLAYAAWLNRHGQAERAELIRVQCEAEQLHAREKALLDRHGGEWSRRLRHLGADRVGFHRGFPEELHMSALHLLATHETLGTITPVRRLHLGAIHDDTLAEVARLPVLAQLRALEIGYPSKTPAQVEPGLPGVTALAESPHLTGLTRLVVHSHDIGAAGAKVIARSPTFANLTHLTLNDPILENTRRGEATTAALVNAPALANLQELQLGRDVIGGHALRRWRENLGPARDAGPAR